MACPVMPGLKVPICAAGNLTTYVRVRSFRERREPRGLKKDRESLKLKLKLRLKLERFVFHWPVATQFGNKTVLAKPGKVVNLLSGGSRAQQPPSHLFAFSSLRFFFFLLLRFAGNSFECRGSLALDKHLCLWLSSAPPPLSRRIKTG